MSLKLTDDQKTLIEKYGLVQEKFGLSPVAARINALLTVLNDNALTFDQIREVLNISKSATSTSIQTLTMLNYINYKTELGDRKRYFYSDLKNWKLKVKQDLESLNELGDILHEIEDSIKDTDAEFKIELSAYSAYLNGLYKKAMKSLEKKSNFFTP